MIKWLVVAVLAAGTFGVLWTAPWKDDVERLSGSARDTFDRARDTLGVLDDATNGDCKAVGTAAPAGVIAAVEAVAREAERRPDARVGDGDGTVRDVARRRAELIGECLSRAPRTGAGWRDLQRRLQAAAQG